MLGVATGSFGESQSTLEEFVEQTGVTFPVVWDDGTYGLWDFPDAISPYPRQVVLGADGRVVYLASEHQEEALDRAVQDAL